MVSVVERLRIRVPDSSDCIRSTFREIDPWSAHELVTPKKAPVILPAVTDISKKRASKDVEESEEPEAKQHVLIPESVMSSFSAQHVEGEDWILPKPSQRMRSLKQDQSGARRYAMCLSQFILVPSR